MKKNKAFQQKYMKGGRQQLATCRHDASKDAEMSPTERFKLRRQMVAAAGKKSTTSLSLFMETYGLEVEEELSTMATRCWAEGVWTNTWPVGQKEAWMTQIREVQTWKTGERPAGAVMCETRDMDFKWPCWHTLVFSDEMTIDMRCV